MPIEEGEGEPLSPWKRDPCVVVVGGVTFVAFVFLDRALRVWPSLFNIG